MGYLNLSLEFDDQGWSTVHPILKSYFRTTCTSMDQNQHHTVAIRSFKGKYTIGSSLIHRLHLSCSPLIAIWVTKGEQLQWCKDGSNLFWYTMVWGSDTCNGICHTSLCFEWYHYESKKCCHVVSGNVVSCLNLTKVVTLADFHWDLKEIFAHIHLLVLSFLLFHVWSSKSLICDWFGLFMSDSTKMIDWGSCKEPDNLYARWCCTTEESHIRLVSEPLFIMRWSTYIQ